MYAIIRTKRLKDGQKINKCFAHNLRTITQANIDSTKKHKNKILVNNLNIDDKKATDFREKMMELYEGLGIKIRKNSVLAREFVATASPEFFKDKIEDKAHLIDEWAKHQVDFMRAEFGEQMRFAILHMDEATPHLHFVITSEKKSVKRYKNRYGTSEKETWSLNSNWINPKFLQEFQTRFAEHNARYGLKRGQRGSKRRHIAPLEYNNRLERRLRTQERLNEETRKKRDEAKRLSEEAKIENQKSHKLGKLAGGFLGGFFGGVAAKAIDTFNGPSPEVLAKIEQAEREAEKEREQREQLKKDLEDQKQELARQLQDMLEKIQNLQNTVTNTTADLEQSNKENARLRDQLEQQKPDNRPRISI